jgi:lipoprotein-anchoring transpeptidase ErfK/SrfK
VLDADLPGEPDVPIGGGRLAATATAWLTVAAVIAAVVFLMLHSAVFGSPIVSPVPVSAAEMRKLPQATTFTSIPAAPKDPDPFAATGGAVIHPLVKQVIYSAPGKPAVGVLPDSELGSPTWVPVVNSSPGWVQVLLPCRPDRATGWIYTAGSAGSQLQLQSTPYMVTVDVKTRKLTIDDGGAALGTWPVAVGAPATPTPAGRTFIMALLAPPRPTYSPLILPLGAHSNAWSTFGGGPGTVGLHGWPDPSVFGQAVSNGCVRVPAQALQKLSRLPLATLVVIT